MDYYTILVIGLLVAVLIMFWVYNLFTELSSTKAIRAIQKGLEENSDTICIPIHHYSSDISQYFDLLIARGYEFNSYNQNAREIIFVHKHHARKSHNKKVSN